MTSAITTKTTSSLTIELENDLYSLGLAVLDKVKALWAQVQNDQTTNNVFAIAGLEIAVIESAQKFYKKYRRLIPSDRAILENKTYRFTHLRLALSEVTTLIILARKLIPEDIKHINLSYSSLHPGIVFRAALNSLLAHILNPTTEKLPFSIGFIEKAPLGSIKFLEACTASHPLFDPHEWAKRVLESCAISKSSLPAAEDTELLRESMSDLYKEYLLPCFAPDENRVWKLNSKIKDVVNPIYPVVTKQFIGLEMTMTQRFEELAKRHPNTFRDKKDFGSYVKEMAEQTRYESYRFFCSLYSQ